MSSRGRVSQRLVSLALLVAGGMTGGCLLGPSYKRPPVEVPERYRATDTVSPAADTGTTSLAETAWTDTFSDAGLQTLIRTALEHNDDLQLAAARVVEAGALVGIARADQLPSVGATGTAGGQRAVFSRGAEPITVAGFSLQGTAAWQLDFWGRYRRTTEAARARLVASEWGRRAVVTTVISEVSEAYLALQTFDLDLGIARRTLASREESLQLAQLREQGGVSSLVDVRQAEQLVHGAKAEIITLERQIAQAENRLSVLIGVNPGPIERAPMEDTGQVKPQIPAGLPSSLLERRPDIQETEQLLVAANAEIGVARSAYFPQIALTGNGGIQSTALAALFTGPTAVWSAAATAVEPIFTAGRTRSQVLAATARRNEAAVVYQETIRRAFQEVADAFIAYQKWGEFLAEERLLLESARDARRLAQVRYEGGVTSYLEVLDADTRLFDAELSVTGAEQNQRAAFVDIYRALGGGWDSNQP